MDSNVGTIAYTFSIEGMHCGSCALLIDDVLIDLDGVIAAETSSRAARTVVQVDTTRCTPSDIAAAIAEAGYRATPVPPS